MFKSSVLYTLMALSLGFNAVAMQGRWRGRAVPVAYNSVTNQWSVLLGHDSNGYWTDFSLASHPQEEGASVATRALAQQTNGVYNVSMNNAPWHRTPSGDIVHFVSVKYTSGHDLYKTARNGKKDDFVWIPASEFISQGTVTRTHNGQPVPVSNGVKSMLQSYLPAALAQLTVPAPAQPVAQHAANNPNSWFGIANAIYFYEHTKPYYEFTNFVDGYPFVLDGALWPTVEQYYQAQKFGATLQNRIRVFVSDNQGSAARKAFDEAQRNSKDVRSDWPCVSTGFMLKALNAKFSQNSRLRDMLLNTGNRVLVENAGANDDFYGAGANGEGKNNLGQLLMHVRNELRTGTMHKYTSRSAAYYR